MGKACMKKKILVAYCDMMIGGSTTGLLGMLNNLDREKYEIFLQLYRNNGVLMEYIPDDIAILPEAAKKLNRIQKILIFLFSGYIFKALRYGIKEKKLFSQQVLSEFQVKCLSRDCEGSYDYGIGFLEGWSDYYLANKVKAARKIGWYHTTVKNAAPSFKLENAWIEKVDSVALVSDSCVTDFVESFPAYKDKAVMVPNIMDSKYVRDRCRKGMDSYDPDYKLFFDFDGTKIITVCRLDIHIKGLDRLVKGARWLADKGYHFLWYIVGDGDEKVQLENMIKQENIQDKVRLVGKRNNPYPLMQCADIICSTSRIEGKPVTVTEAMILGTVPVVTEYISANEQIRNGYDGMVAANDDKSVFQILAALMNEPRKIRQIQNNLQAEDYGNKRLIADIEKKLFVD